MSLSLTNAQQTEFDSLVKIEYRSKGFILRDTIRMRPNVIGAFVDFRKVGQIIAQETAFQSEVVTQDPGFNKVTATLKKYMAPSAVDVVQDLTVNFDAKRELAMITAMAIGRRSDQIIIDALAANPFVTIPNGGTNMTWVKMRQIIKYFNDNAVDNAERYVAMTANNWSALLADDRITSRLFTSNDAAVSGNAFYSPILGLNIRLIPQMTEGGLPLTGNIRTALAWQQMSSGMGLGQDMRVEINYIPQKTSYLVNGIFYAGATVIDNRGVLAIACDESVQP